MLDREDKRNLLLRMKLGTFGATHHQEEKKDDKFFVQGKAVVSYKLARD